jgi:hypothetical protein
MSRVSSLAKVVLPLPVSPTTATRVRGVSSRSTSCRTSGPAGVGEGDVVEADADRTGRQDAPALGRVGDVARGVEHAEHPAQAGEGVLRLVEHLGGDLHRLDEQRDEEQEADEAAGRDVAGDAEQHADDDHRAGRDGGRHLAGGEGHGGDALGAGLRDPGGVDGAVDALGGAACTPYARMTGAPTTDSATAPSISPTRRRTAPYAPAAAAGRSAPRRPAAGSTGRRRA